MNENIITILILIVQFLPIIFVFSLIGWIIYKILKDRIDVSIAESIFSWLFFGFYAMAFCLTIIFLAFGKKIWSLISFILLAVSLLLFALIDFIVNRIKKHQLKHRETKIVQAKLVGAVERVSTTKTLTGREPRSNNLYSLVFEYEEKGKKKICTTNNLYKLSQVAYINKQREAITIKVDEKTCDIEMDISMAPVDYDLEDISNLKITSNESTGSSQYYIEIFATLAISIPFFIITTLSSLVLWKNSETYAFVILIIGVVAVLVTDVATILYCRRKIKISKYGVEAFALDFANVGKTYANGTYCYIKYTFETKNGIKTKKERVTIDAYGKIRNLNKLPIKVYKNLVAIDLDRIP
ncbi:MAG: hypothetical protein ACI4T8_00690 [Christensenellales bacterium]